MLVLIGLGFSKYSHIKKNSTIWKTNCLFIVVKNLKDMFYS